MTETEMKILADQLESEKRYLEPYFDAVVNPADWRAPISAVVSFTDLEPTIRAIQFFTATTPTVSPIPDHCGNPLRFRVTSCGYRNGPAGP